MEKLELKFFEEKDIRIDNKVVLHIVKNDEGYIFDVYNANLYDKDKLDEGLVVGTWATFDEIECLEEDEDEE